ncbi:MAG: type I-F CRISPR-associated protein Csy3 [Burkholderiales bacterium]|nr:type I-F CRISPR-associated protein Csy3 [Burkholderiales bacterium]MBK8666602.1 type I-F CRISPR-associated protein Csy3 [Burkholderiales bacterium]
MTKKLTTPTVLAFERKLDPSDAVFFSGNWNVRQVSTDWVPVPVREKSVRGTASHRSKAKGSADQAKQDMKFESPNPQTVDVATLPPQADTLKVQFTLRVLGGAGTPSACNSAAYQTKLLATVQGYVSQHGFGELARRYAANLANGRFLWRNRIGAESVDVIVEQMQDGKAHETWSFDALALNTRAVGAADSEAINLQELGQVIASGLAGDAHVLLQVTAFVRQGAGQEVFPSQELVLDKGSAGKSKTLYDVGGVAAIHSQKIGNAIRTIDTWYEGADELGPIAVEPYGSVTTQGKAYRQPKQKLDFYTLLDNWLLKDQVPPVEQQHFVMAVLIRGGVFGDAS